MQFTGCYKNKKTHNMHDIFTSSFKYILQPFRGCSPPFIHFLLLPNPCYEACNPSSIALHLYSLTCACVFEDPKLNGEAAKAALANEDCPHIDQAISPEDGQIFSSCEPRGETPCFLLNMTGRATHPGARVRKGTQELFTNTQMHSYKSQMYCIHIANTTHKMSIYTSQNYTEAEHTHNRETVKRPKNTTQICSSRKSSSIRILFTQQSLTCAQTCCLDYKN